MRVEDFDYNLPQELIAQEPIPNRDQARLLVVHRGEDRFEHRNFRDLLEYLRPGDVVVLNNSRVLPARIYARRAKTGGRVETFLLRPLGGDRWEVLVKPGRRAPVGEELLYGNGELQGKVIATTDAGGRIIEFSYEGSFREHLQRLGEVPLPPYIHKKLADPERYQTVYASQEGSVAAPTAGLHFTRDFLREMADCGVEVCYLTLHVGLGTFRPVKAEVIEEHKMHSEYYEVTPQVATAVNGARREGRRVMAVGTTVVRTLESAASADGLLRPGEGWTDLFIYPGYKFKVVDAMLTNFHLPRSTLLMLVSAFAGRGKILAAYQEAVRERYRFFSFGDAMLII
ncbi:MAG: tRNA preQ1(34) S-adenosylmethionine ribosyltransferase-isomerase QueA [bacterium]